MKRVLKYLFLGFILINTLIAEDKLDILDKQSKDFFNAIIGLEKDYLEKQIVDIKKKADLKVRETNTVNSGQNIISTEQLPINNQISQEEYAKNVFRYENEMARLTTDFTRTKKLKDIKIKSMYSFNSKKYVVLKLIEDNEEDTTKESSLKIEGRYKTGDNILTHKIVDINTQTKTVKLYKKLDEEYGYYIVLSNYGISVSDLKKVEKVEEKKVKIIKPEEVSKMEVLQSESIPEFSKKAEDKKTIKKINECLYKVIVSNLNVRNTTDTNGKILRVLRKGDEFTIQSKKDDWVHINTIYKKLSGDIMIVEDENNWVKILDSLVQTDSQCL